MNRTKIEWCSHTWNPVTGCLHNCVYCYARDIAWRFRHKSDSDERVWWEEMGWVKYTSKHPKNRTMFTLNELFTDMGYRFPFGFAPTFHRYRLGEPAAERKSRDVFVCSMADLFGEWVPLDWIRDVLDACAAAPQHRYLFLTKNPGRYTDLGKIALLPHEENFWYGVTVTDEGADKWYRFDDEKHNDYHLFWSVEPLLGSVKIAPKIEGVCPPEWVIIGAETGNRINKVIPEREWVDDIRAFCEDNGIPVFYKDSLRKLFPDLPESRFPWK